MTSAEKLELLQAWDIHSRNLDSAWDSLSALTGAELESPLGRAVYFAFDDYTKAIGQLVGDQGGWLAWWVYENNRGAKNCNTVYPVTHGKKKFRASTLRDLLRIIEAK